MAEQAVLSGVPALPGVEVLSGTHHGDNRFAPHWHDTWGLAAVLDGVCRFTCGGAKWTASAGHIVVLPPFAVHTAGVGPQGLRMSMGYLPDALVSELLGLAPGEAPLITVHTAPGPAEALAAAYASGERGPVAAALRLMLDLSGGRTGPLPRPDREDWRITRLCSALRAEAGARPDLGALAAALNLSREHVQRFFKKVVGLTPAEYARLARLERARRALRAGLTPAEAAADAGFTDQAHLTRWFKAVYGVTPGRLV